MVGLTAHESAQLRVLLNIRRLISIRRFKGRPQEKFLTVIFLVFAFPAPIMLATFSAVGYRHIGGPWDSEILGGVLTGLWAFWLLAPLFGVQLNEAPDMSRFLVLPIRRRAMIIATFAGAIFDYSTWFTLPFLIAILFGAWGASATIVVVLACVIAAAHFIAAGQLMTTVTSGLVRSRRFRDLATVLSGALVLAYWYYHMKTLQSEPYLRDYFKKLVQNDVHPLNALQWTPAGACARAIERASTGHMAEALLWLAGSASVLAAIAAAWWWALNRVATQGEFVFGSNARRAHHPSKTTVRGRSGKRIPLLSPTVIALAALDLRQMWRNPGRRLATLQGLFMPVFFSILWIGRERLAGPLLALAPGIFVTFSSLFLFQNVMATDGLAVATLFLSPLDRRDVFRGKVLAFAVVAAAPVAVLTALIMVRGSISLALSGLFLAAATFMVVAAVVSAVSARVAVPIQNDRRTGALRTNTAAGYVIALLQPTLIAFVLAPFWIPAVICIVTHRPALGMGAAAAGLAYALVVFHFAIKNAGATLTRREPEIFQMLDPKAA